MEGAKGAPHTLAVAAGQTPTEAIGAMNWQTLADNLAPVSLQLGRNAVVSASHDGENFTLTYELAPVAAGTPGLVWEPVPNASGQEEAFFGWQSSAYDSAEDALHLSSMDVTLTYNVSGLITTSDDIVEMRLRITITVALNQHYVGQDTLSTTANILDALAGQRRKPVLRRRDRR